MRNVASTATSGKIPVKACAVTYCQGTRPTARPVTPIETVNVRSKMDKTNEGRRVELTHTDDPYTKLRSGSQGTYEFCLVHEPPMENQHSIKWDDGSSMMLLEGKDRFKFLDHE